MLKNFTVDSGRDLLVPDFQCYQMDLSGPVELAISAGEVDDDDFKLLPSWSKFSANPLRSKGFFTRTLNALFEGQGGHDELNVDDQAEIYNRDRPRVAMMFFSANNGPLKLIGDIAKQTLPAFEVIVLCGSTLHNGRAVNNKRAQQVVTEVISTGKPTLIIASQMAQRSFSIPEMTELFLAYDRGENGATIQKMSRVLTPATLDKVGHIFSLSFDPNRDDKFDALVVETALNHKKRNGMRSMVDAMRDVLRSIDIYRCSPDGKIKIDPDDYLAAALDRNGISRVLGKIVNMGLLSPEAIAALAAGDSDYFRNDNQDVTPHGKTRESQGNRASGVARDIADAKELAKAREMITTILENLDYIILGTNNRVLADAMDAIERDPVLNDCVKQEFGVDTAVISYLFKQGVIKQEWVELLLDHA